MNGSPCLVPRLRDEDAFAEREAIGFDDGGERRGFNVGHGVGSGIEYLVFGRGNMVFFHQIFGKNFAAFDARGFGIGAEAGDAFGGERINGTEHERIIRRNNGVVDRVRDSEFDDGVEVGCTNGHALRVLCHAAVARKCVDFGDIGIFTQLADDGMFASAAAHNQQVHKAPPFDRKIN